MPSSWFEPLRARAAHQTEAVAESRAALAEAAAVAASRAAPALLAMQKPDGYWVGDLLADTTLEEVAIIAAGTIESDNAGAIAGSIPPEEMRLSA